jgi:hypothetical protein
LEDQRLDPRWRRAATAAAARPSDGAVWGGAARGDAANEPAAAVGADRVDLCPLAVVQEHHAAVRADVDAAQR